MRNPIFYAEAIIEYDRSISPWREQRIIPDKRARLEELRQGHNTASLVRQHFAEPDVAWNAALDLNDGGVSHLLSSLARVCNPATKVRQIAEQLIIVVRDVQARLDNYYVPANQDERRQEKLAAAQKVVGAVDKLLNAGQLGAFVGSIMVSADEVARRIDRIPESVRIDSDDTVSPTAEVLPSPFASLAPTPPVSDAKEQPLMMTIERFRAKRSIEYWIETMERNYNDQRLSSGLGIDRDCVRSLIDELEFAARRMGVRERLEDLLKETISDSPAQNKSLPAAIVCAEAVNGFVATLGQDSVAEEDRPVVNSADGETAPVFTPRPVRFSADDLPVNRVNTAREFRNNWVFALADMYMKNAEQGDDENLNTRQNTRLGDILNTAKSTETRLT